MRREKFKVVRMVIDLEGNKGRRRPTKRWLDVIVGQCVNDARDACQVEIWDTGG